MQSSTKARQGAGKGKEKRWAARQYKSKKETFNKLFVEFRLNCLSKDSVANLFLLSHNSMQITKKEIYIPELFL